MVDIYKDHIDGLNDLAFEVIEERLNQIETWGQQDHQSAFGAGAVREFGRAADRWKQVNEARVETDQLTWDGILLEEVYEALAETDLDLRRAELIQVAAVALAEVESIDRELAYDEDEDEDDLEVLELFDDEGQA